MELSSDMFRQVHQGRKKTRFMRDGSATEARNGREKYPGNMNNSYNNKLLCRNKKIALFNREMFLPQAGNEREISAKKPRNQRENTLKK